MYSLTQADLESLNTEELKGTQKFLPDMKDIPLEFRGMFAGVPNNAYFKIAEAMYVGDKPDSSNVTINAGFTGKDMAKFMKAHLYCIYPDYEHRIAGVAYMISKVVTVKE